MIFKVTDTNHDFDLEHYCSENNQWEIGTRSISFGIRVCGKRVDALVYAFDYWCGDIITLSVVLYLVKKILEKLPETITSREIEELLPCQIYKPILKDKAYDELEKLACVPRTRAYREIDEALIELIDKA